MTKTLENNLPDNFAEVVCCLIILPDRPTELLIWEIRPYVRAAKPSMIGDRIISTDVVGL